jgi:hypothetical protein
MVAQQLDKTFSCLTCKQNIRLARRDDNSGWLKYNLDGTEHKHEKQQQQGYPSKTSQQITQLSEEVKGLRETVNILVSQITMLRSDVKNKK